jgi:hypothetical protein
VLPALTHTELSFDIIIDTTLSTEERPLSNQRKFVARTILELSFDTTLIYAKLLYWMDAGGGS